MIKRFAPLAVLAILFATSTARADIGVVVTGEATLQPQLLSHLESWLKKRGYPVYSSALEPDAINTLIDCFVVEDLNCAKKVIEARAKSDTILYARVDVAPSDNGKRDISIVGYWVAKGHDTMAERRVCHACTEKQMHDVVEDLMLVLAQGSADRLARPRAARPRRPPRRRPRASPKRRAEPPTDDAAAPRGARRRDGRRWRARDHRRGVVRDRLACRRPDRRANTAPAVPPV